MNSTTETALKTKTTQMVAHKTRLHVNNRQASFLRQCIGIRRLAYNWALAEWEWNYFVWRCWQDEDLCGPRPPKPENFKKLNMLSADKLFNKFKKDMKAEMPWLYDVPSCCGQQAITRDLDNAIKRFFKNLKTVKLGEKPGYPKFKNRHRDRSVTFTNAVIKSQHIRGNRLVLPKKMGTAKLGQQLRYDGKLMKTTITEKAGKFYCSFVIEQQPSDMRVLPPAKNQAEVVGIDLGVCNFATLNTGQKIEPAHAYAKHKNRIARANRKLAKMKKFSNNWKKQRQLIAKLEFSEANVRANHHHKISSQLAKLYGTVVLEDLKIKNMTKSAKGNKAKPGKNVKQKSGLNRSILDCGFYQFRSFVQYKTERHGGNLVLVNPKYTSQECNRCGHTTKLNRKKQAEFKCIACGHSDHADVNAAKNIRDRGLKILESNQ